MPQFHRGLRKREQICLLEALSVSLGRIEDSDDGKIVADECRVVQYRVQLQDSVELQNCVRPVCLTVAFYECKMRKQRSEFFQLIVLSPIHAHSTGIFGVAEEEFLTSFVY